MTLVFKVLIVNKKVQATLTVNCTISYPPFNVLFGDIGNTFAGMLESDQDKNLKAVILSGTQLCRRSPKTTGTGRENLQLRSE